MYCKVGLLFFVVFCCLIVVVFFLILITNRLLCVCVCVGGRGGRIVPLIPADVFSRRLVEEVGRG